MHVPMNVTLKKYFIHPYNYKTLEYMHVAFNVKD